MPSTRQISGEQSSSAWFEAFHLRCSLQKLSPTGMAVVRAPIPRIIPGPPANSIYNNSHATSSQRARYTHSSISTAIGVDKTTLGCRVNGKQVKQSDARRDEQLFSPGEENAIMGKLGFPLSKSMLMNLAHDMLNKRPISLHSQQQTIKGMIAKIWRMQIRFIYWGALVGSVHASAFEF